jgi:hypothetical protein
LAQRSKIAWFKTWHHAEQIASGVEWPAVVGGVPNRVFPAERNTYMVRVVTEFDPEILLHGLPPRIAHLDGLLESQAIFINDRPM